MPAAREVLLNHLANAQKGTAPIEVSIGYTSAATNQVQHDALVIRKAAPRIVREVMDFADRNDNVFVSAANDGLTVQFL